MDDSQRKSRLKESLHTAMNLNILASSKEYKDTLLPHLNKLSHIIPIRSEAYKTKEEYQFALENNNMRASVYQELISFLSSQESIMNKIRQEMEKPKKNYGI